MKASTLTVTEAARNFSEYISRVTYRDESFVLCKGKKPVAELRPLASGRRLGDLPGILESLPHLSKEDAAAFASDLESARDSLAADEVNDPWES